MAIGSESAHGGILFCIENERVASQKLVDMGWNIKGDSREFLSTIDKDFLDGDDVFILSIRTTYDVPYTLQMGEGVQLSVKNFTLYPLCTFQALTLE